MALPIALAACSSEEIVENAGANLQNRNVLPQISVAVESGVDSRFSWNEENFSWNKFTANDQFAGGLTDGATLWDVKDMMLTNYIFKDAEGKGSFSTTSQMVEGTYFFYSFPGFETVATRQGVPFDLTSQTSIDFENPTAAVEKNQLFISHLYKLEAATANNALPITFYSYWATAALKVKNTSGETFKIVRAMLNTKDDEKFALKGTLKPSLLGTNDKENEKIKGSIYSYNATADAYVLGYVDPSASEKVRTDKNAIRTLPMADVTDGKAEAGMLLDCGMYELEDGEEAIAYFQVPAGVYSDLTVTLFVEVTEGEDEDAETRILELAAVDVHKNAKSATTATTNDVTKLEHGVTKALFGTEEGQIAAYEVDDYAIMDASEAGLYAASYEDLAAIVKEAEAGDVIAVNNMGSLKVEDKLIKLLSTKANEDKIVKFLNSVEISTDKTSADLANIQVVNGTIVKGKFVASADLVGNITVNPGTELTVTADQTGTITNKGTLNLKKTNLIANITDGADAEKEIETTVNVEKAMNINVGSGSAKVLMDMPTNLYLKKDAALTSGNTVILLKNTTIGYGQNLYVAANVLVTGNNKLVNNGYIENKGEISELKNAGEENKVAVIENYGTLTTVHSNNEYAEIEQKERTAKIVAITDNKGTVDNTIGAFVSNVTSTGEGCVFAEYDGEDKTGLLGNVQGVTKIIVKNCTWTDAKLPTSYTGDIVLTAVTLNKTETGSPLITWNKVTISGNSVVEFEVTMNGTLKSTEFKNNLTTTATVLQDVTVAGLLTASATTLDLIGANLNNVTAANLGTLNINDLEVVGASSTSHTAKTTTLNGVFTAGSMNRLNVNHDATLIVENGATIGNASTQVKIGAAGAHTNSKAGKILEYGEIICDTANSDTW